MVGPVSESERAAFRRKLQVGVVALVAASCGLIALQTDASLPVTAGITAVGGVIGVGLAWFIVPSGPSPVERQRRRRKGANARENPFDSVNDDDATGGEETTDRRASAGRD